MHIKCGILRERIIIRDCPKRGTMGVSYTTCRLLVILLFISIALQTPEKVYGLRNIDLVLRRNAAEIKPSTSKEANVVGFDVKKELEAPSPSTFDLNRTSKRRVRRGSDPIHNRC